MKDVQQASVAILSNATATGAGSAHKPRRAKKTFHAYGTTSAGAGAATIKVQASNDNVNWIDLATIALTLATTVAAGAPGTDGFSNDAAWRYVRANVTAISGTDAQVSVYMGT